MVKRQTGHDKVDLLPVSLGGTILTAYLDAYGHKDINSIVGVVACLNGTDIVADMMARDFNISDEYLHHEYIPTILKESNGRGTLATSSTVFSISCRRRASMRCSPAR